MSVDQGWRHRWELLLALTAKELKAKYKNTVLGYLWSVIAPLAQTVIFYVVFSVFLRFPIENYFLYLSIGFFVWQFFSNSLSQSAMTLVANANLIRKTRAPRAIFVCAAVATESVHLLTALPVMLIFMLACGRVPEWSAFLVLPAAFVAVVLFTLGLCLVAAAVNARFRDLERILQILLQIWFYATPIFYGKSQMPPDSGYWRWLHANPMTSMVTLWRDVFYEPCVSWPRLGLALGFGVVCALLGRLLFGRLKRNLAEVL